MSAMASEPRTHREVRLLRPIAGAMREHDFGVVTVQTRAPGEGEVEVENQFLSVDPWMRESAEVGQAMIPEHLVFRPGRPLLGAAVGRVVASRDPAVAPGQLVQSMLGFRERFTAPADEVQVIDQDGLPARLFLGVLGVTGLTAWVGIRLGEVRAGDTVFVSAASGAVGSIACQLAVQRGARVIASAGGAEKGAFVRTLGVDAVIDHRREPDLRAALAAVAPEGLDVYFDNVGGRHLAAAVDATRPEARIVLCGKLSTYDPAEDEAPDLGLAIPRSLRFVGFSVRRHLHELDAFRRELGDLVRDGRIHAPDTIEDGLDAAPRALMRVLSGDKLGKMLVRVG